MNSFERPFSGTPEEAKRLFDKMRNDVEQGIVTPAPVPPEFDIQVPESAVEQAPLSDAEPLPAPKKKKDAVIPPGVDFQTGAKAMEDWERERDDKEDERRRRIEEGGA